MFYIIVNKIYLGFQLLVGHIFTFFTVPNLYQTIKKIIRLINGENIL